MKRFKKCGNKILSVIVALMMIVSTFTGTNITAFAEEEITDIDNDNVEVFSAEDKIAVIDDTQDPVSNTAVYTIGTAEGKPGDIVKVALSLDNKIEGGFIRSDYKPEYDTDNLELLSVEDGTTAAEFGMRTNSFDKWSGTGYYRFYSAFEGSGEVVVFNFKVKNTAEAGTYAIGFAEGSAKFYSGAYASNSKLIDTETTVNAGSITVQALAENEAVAPSAVEELYYNGLEQTGVATGKNYTVTNGTAVNADTYKATATLNAGCVWTDSTTEPKEIEWTINKAYLSAMYQGETVDINDTPAYEIKVTGFVNGETPETAAGYEAPTVTGAPETMEIGTYFVQTTGGKADNYNFRYNTGVLRIVELCNIEIVTIPENANVSVVAGNQFSSTEKKVKLEKNGTYTATVTADGYNSYTKTIKVTGDETITVELTKSTHVGNQIIYGSNNEGKNYTITKGGEYSIAEEASGNLIIDTTEPVTLIGRGVGISDKNSLFIDCLQEGTTLTLRDVNLNSRPDDNMIDFVGKGNNLKFEGTNIIDHNVDGASYAMIHVTEGEELTVSGGLVYFYKRGQGAGIGGDTGEACGTINIVGAEMFLKNSKQGACIGSGSNAATTTPGDINIVNSNLYMIAMSRGTMIGGSAGSGGGAAGSYVTVENSTLSFNIDWSGAAIGGGGYDGGNDADGGTLNMVSGSIRAYINENAKYSWNVEERGVNGNIAITADIIDSEGNPQYLLTFDTTQVAPADTYTVVANGKTIYSGELHKYAFINEEYSKSGDSRWTNIEYTIDNWKEISDTNLYMYTTGETQLVTVNGEPFEAVWNGETETFTLEKLVNIASDQITIDEIEDQIYTGEEITPEVVVKDGERTLEKDVDYTVAYADNTEVGTATVTITGIGDYAGSVEVTFAIVEAGHDRPEKDDQKNDNKDDQKNDNKDDKNNKPVSGNNNKGNGTSASGNSGKTNTVKTGDENSSLLWFLLLAVSCGCGVGVVLKKRKRA